tara:strand:+ start:2704 stop:3177 length:474 start_codon:yes stop_codon:yes gene_type:complete
MIITIILIAISILFIMAWLSEASSVLPADGQILTPCPNKPNCVCSEYSHDIEHYIEPLSFSLEQLPKTIDSVKISVESLGGKMKTASSTYLAATFSSSFFGFIDDVEFRIDEKNQLIHIRSAARSGYSDFGINKKRVNNLKKILRQQLEKTASRSST